MAASVKVSDVGCPKCQAAPGDSCYGEGTVAIGGMATIGGGPAYHWARRGVLYGVEVFENEDDRYLAWLTMNPYGFVLDCSLSSDPILVTDTPLRGALRPEFHSLYQIRIKSALKAWV